MLQFLVSAWLKVAYMHHAAASVAWFPVIELEANPLAFGLFTNAYAPQKEAPQISVCVEFSWLKGTRRIDLLPTYYGQDRVQRRDVVCWDR